MNTCRKCQNVFPNFLIIDGIRRNLQRRRFCLDCSPFGQHNTKSNLLIPKNQESKICNSCLLEFSLTKENFYFQKMNGKLLPYGNCKSCHNKFCSDKQKDTKSWAIQIKGGRCECCGYSKCPDALEFHHTNPKEKEFNLNKMRSKNRETILSELQKCQLLCANCHRELHYAIRVGGSSGSRTHK